jgi:hypothetical protein
MTSGSANYADIESSLLPLPKIPRRAQSFATATINPFF